MTAREGLERIKDARAGLPEDPMEWPKLRAHGGTGCIAQVAAGMDEDPAREGSYCFTLGFGQPYCPEFWRMTGAYDHRNPAALDEAISALEAWVSARESA